VPPAGESSGMKSLLITILCSQVIGVSAAAPHTEEVAGRAMKAADRNKDGRLSLEEFKLLDVQAKHHGDEHFERGDVNQDGFLDRGELATELAAKQTWFVILCEGVEACFLRLDTDKNQKLDPQEYRKVSRMGGHAEQHHRGADANKDGQLDLAEFTAHAEAKLNSAADPSTKRKKKSAGREPSEN
jgi:Ca2+-binding EF-hand superfamily protein